MNIFELAKWTVARAKRRGVKHAEAYAEISRDAGVRVRDGAVEDLTQATSKGLGLRVIAGGRLGFAYTSDLRQEALDALVDRAIALAKVSASDPHNVLPKGKQLAKPGSERSDLFDPAIADIDPEWKLQAALEIEKAAKGHDARVVALESVGAGENVHEVAIASSEGARGHYRGTYAYLYCAPVAREGEQLQTAYWVDYRRNLAALATPESIGREAARRAVRMLGARKVSSAQVPVILEPMMAASFIGGLAAAVNGDMVFKRSSFLAAKLGKKIAPAGFNLYDDGLLPSGIASAPFDGEGVARRKSAIIEGGVLRQFLYDAYTAHKAAAPAPTGSASRSFSALPSIGTSNFYLAAGEAQPADLIKGLKQGLIVTTLLGHGPNPVTGDFSSGANGLWVENGEIARPVQEITIAGNLLQMLGSIDAIGSDFELRGPIGAPSIRFAELTVSGA